MPAASYEVASFRDDQQLPNSKLNPCQSPAGPTGPHQRATLRCLVEGENEQRWMSLISSFLCARALTVDDEPNDDNEDGYGYNSYDGACGRSGADNQRGQSSRPKTGNIERLGSGVKERRDG